MAVSLRALTKEIIMAKAPFKPFEKSSKDKEKGKGKEGSKREEAADKKQALGKTKKKC
jgi:hypothetical protein